MTLSFVLALPMACGDADTTGPGGQSATSTAPSATATSSTTSAATQSTATGTGTTSGTASSSGGAGGGLPLGEPDCHPRETSTARGAYFRKVSGEPSIDAVGIHLTGKLPRVEIDLARWFTTDVPELGYQNGPLDRPSVYVGGRASNVEIDAGLTWDRVYDATGRPTWTDNTTSGSDEGDPSRRFVVEGGVVTSATGVVRPQGLEGLVESFAFRPFWRAEGMWHNPPLASGAPYFFPGQGYRMQLKATGSARLELAINAAESADSFLVVFDVSGWGVGAAQSWKRVSSIDQFTVQGGARVGLETAGLDVLPTHTRVIDGAFSEVKVLRSGGETLFHLDCERPAIVGADALWQTDYDQVFRLFDQDATGAERLQIVPPPG